MQPTWYAWMGPLFRRGRLRASPLPLMSWRLGGGDAARYADARSREELFEIVRSAP
jgi:hypothetical protein